ncbi:MAG: hypothetical protein II567_11730 [Candidatus Riflebacteria bacterium]|nr:hypothetical protein [Candidatus Riflebacteria bacterium]
MKAISVLCAVLLGVSSLCQAQTWTLEYGDKNEQFSYCNRWNTNEKYEGTPYGPMSFRVINNKLWILDSVAGRICCFDEKNTLLKNIVIPDLKGFKMLEDFALVGDNPDNPDAIWVANASDNIIRKISVANGKVLAQFGGRGNTSGKFVQVKSLEVDAGGRLYVADVGRNKLSVFTSTGAFLRDYPWQSTGFVVDRYANLHMIHYREEGGYFYRIYSPKGQLTSNIHLGFLDYTNVCLHSVEKDGSLILTLVPPTGYKGKLDCIKINKFGDVIEKDSLIPSVAMNRYFYSDNNKFYIAEADFEAAPVSKFIVKPFEFGKNAIAKKEQPKVKEGAKNNDK